MWIIWYRNESVLTYNQFKSNSNVTFEVSSGFSQLLWHIFNRKGKQTGNHVFVTYVWLCVAGITRQTNRLFFAPNTLADFNRDLIFFP